jgi:hypothetical protein
MYEKKCFELIIEIKKVGKVDRIRFVKTVAVCSIRCIVLNGACCDLSFHTGAWQ